MRRWDGRLLRLFRALLACTVLLFAAHGPVASADPVRDVSAWVAVSRGRVAAPARAERRALASRQQQPPPVANGSVSLFAARTPRSVPPAAFRAPDGRYTYLIQQTLRC